MKKPAIRVVDLGKKYRIGEQKSRVVNLSERIYHGMRRLKSTFNKRNNPSSEFWALKDLSFEVPHGEVVGIIGRNGAGKSTLLKILSRIVEPSTGYAEVRGRLGSLLEVGTGFHSELTGRENIFLNGSILGLKRTEIQARFDDIVQFSGIEQFLDTPVKRYSSGMYVRLAFSVAAHLNPDILIVDEVLAVGDSNFQKQCLGKMRDVSTSGRTVLFVSHNMSAVESLCTYCMSMQDGKLKIMGKPAEVIQNYLLSSATSDRSTSLEHCNGRRKGSVPLMKQVTLDSGVRSNVSHIQMGQPFSIIVQFESSEHPIKPNLGVVIKDKYDVPVFGINNNTVSGSIVNQPISSGTIKCAFDNLPLMPGTYSIDLFLGEEQHDLDVVMDAASFSVESADVYGTGKIPSSTTGNVFVPATFCCSVQA